MEAVWKRFFQSPLLTSTKQLAIPFPFQRLFLQVLHKKHFFIPTLPFTSNQGSEKATAIQKRSFPIPWNTSPSQPWNFELKCWFSWRKDWINRNLEAPITRLVYFLWLCVVFSYFFAVMMIHKNIVKE